ncbi:MAG: GtrA family protein [Candidatus Lokiarchaeota archaeon]|nr:GtrA family protein [Candidatus Harpocratesius repetitus]
MRKQEESTEKHKIKELSNHVWFQLILYFSFAVLMVLLNIGIQNFHLRVIFPWLQPKLSTIPFFYTFYISTDPYNMPEIVGSILAVGITYIIKFFLDKFFVFQQRSNQLKETGKQFTLYFLFAIVTTLENLLIQFLLGIWTNISLDFRIIIALACGYSTKFILDKKFSFKKRELGNQR